jgi:hypothetical protein
VTEVMDKLSRWLAAWGGSTGGASTDSTRLRQQVLGAASALAALLPDGGRYTEWLASRFAELDCLVPVVPAHNDLSVWNVVLDKHRALGVLDWEEACAEGLPLVDFFYAKIDAVMCSRRDSNRLAAVQACFTPPGAYYNTCSELLRRLKHAVAVPDELVDLCFHACFLSHAANELARDPCSREQQFLSVAAWTAEHRDELPTWLADKQ